MRELEGLAPHPPREHHWLKELRGVLATREVWPSFFMMFGVTGSLFSFAGLWGVPLMRDVFGLDRTGASGYTTSALAAFAVGCLVSGWLSDRLGRRKPVIVSASALSVAAWLALIFLPWGLGWSGLLIFAALGVSRPADLWSATRQPRKSFRLEWREWRSRSSTPASSWARPSCSRHSDGPWI